MAGTEDFARSAVERLSEDEALRGDLSDVGFGPLLDWAIAAAMAYTASDQSAMDKYADRLRGVVMAAVDVAEKGKMANPAELLDFDPANPATATEALKALKLDQDADENATMIAGVLQAALQKPPPAAQPVPKTELTSAKEAPATTKTAESKPAPAQIHQKGPAVNPKRASKVSAFFKKLNFNRRKS